MASGVLRERMLLLNCHWTSTAVWPGRISVTLRPFRGLLSRCPIQQLLCGTERGIVTKDTAVGWTQPCPVTPGRVTRCSVTANPAVTSPSSPALPGSAICLCWWIWWIQLTWAAQSSSMRLRSSVMCEGLNAAVLLVLVHADLRTAHCRNLPPGYRILEFLWLFPVHFYLLPSRDL